MDPSIRVPESIGISVEIIVQDIFQDARQIPLEIMEADFLIGRRCPEMLSISYFVRMTNNIDESS